MIDPQVQLLAGKLNQLARRISQLERNQRASMGPVSVASGAITFTDAAGTPQMVVGQQGDGTFTAASVTQQAPDQPDEPLAGPGILGIWVYWDGQMASGSAPLSDFAAAQVHCSAQAGFIPSAATLQGTLAGAGLFGVGNLTAGTTYYACLVAVNQAGNASTPSGYAQATAQAVPDFIPAGSISGLQMQTGTLTAAQLAEEAGILGSQIAKNTITDENIQAGTITADSIASNTITAAQIVAGIVIAGIINGTTITGAEFIGDGNGLEFVLYSGTPAANNMVLSSCTTSTTDSSGNQVLPGFSVYGGSGTTRYALNIQGLAPLTSPQVQYFAASSQTAGWGPAASGLGFQDSFVVIPASIALAVGGAAGGEIQVTSQGGSGTAIVTADGNGVLEMEPEGDSNTYKVGHFTVANTSAVNVTSTSGAAGLLSVSVAALSYRMQGRVIFSGNQAAGGAQILYGGTATISHADGYTSYSRSGGGTHIDSGTTSLGAANSPTFTGTGLLVAEFDYNVTFSGLGGTLTVLGLCTNSGDTWVAHSTYATLEIFQ